MKTQRNEDFLKAREDPRPWPKQPMKINGNDMISGAYNLKPRPYPWWWLKPRLYTRPWFVGGGGDHGFTHGRGPPGVHEKK